MFPVTLGDIIYISFSYKLNLNQYVSYMQHTTHTYINYICIYSIQYTVTENYHIFK